ncbi:hypothetical protein C807_02850 [Lachnospiraceae bacterium 28-4]|nr:hypothetical protein C807_02850 [Lachnospiraceae bacterium 28-4]
MRKREKNRLLEIMDTLFGAVGEIRQFIGSSQEEEAVSLLADCQEAAIAIGNAIEQAEGAGTRTVGLLEELCELIYGCASSIPSDGSGTSASIGMQIADKCAEAREELIHGIKEQKLAVFLPYKVSMWDSLESIWKAASEDRDWISTVMPIPYFDKKADGTLGEMRYEGEDFPPDVPVADWEKFSLEKERPDIIFIHNPYDQYNYVTTVHPLFYASRIKQYTEKLVYIPYFIHQNDMVEDTYCLLPGVIYADIVVLQSEKVREQYIRYFEETLPELVQKQGQKMEDKFQAWGSPKLDALYREEGEEALPGDWKELLGGGNKKVIFFNTHLSRLMKENSDGFFKKMEWVFRIFGRRDDVVLLWRPHPLSLDTAKSMNPGAVRPYLDLVEQYKKEKIGIYDDSGDLHRAVKMADAYYGDRSSVTELFRQQGKPVMIMDCEVLEE